MEWSESFIILRVGISSRLQQRFNIFQQIKYTSPGNRKKEKKNKKIKDKRKEPKKEDENEEREEGKREREKKISL